MEVRVIEEAALGFGRWFAGLLPQVRVQWLEAGQTGSGFTMELLATLPDGHRPGCAEAWVFGPVDSRWLAAGADVPGYVPALEFDEFLRTKYGTWYGVE
jgi:hypothetical protein